jgi:hypothetical protein
MTLSWGTPLLLLAIAACAHELPPEPRVGVLDSIPDVGPPVRLTLNPGKDAAPLFSPDGNHVWYSWERIDRSDLDLCLGRIPVGGGTRDREICHSWPAAHPDSVNWYIWAAPHPDGKRLAWFRLSGRRDAPRGYSGEMVIAGVDVPLEAVRIDSMRNFPTQVAPDHFHEQPERIRWVDDTTLVYLAVQVVVLFNFSLPQDTLYSGFEIGIIRMTGGGAQLTYVPGTSSASGFDLGPAGEIYFTKNGDNRVFRTSLAGGVIDTVLDFGPGTEIVRDPVVIGSVVYAIVDGDVTYQFFQDLGNLQSDAGGELWRATPSGAELVDSTRRWRHPAWDPNRNLLAIEGRDPVTRVTDIYLFEIDP